MLAGKYGCHTCKAFLETSVSSSFENLADVKCPRCGSIDVDMLPAWVPIGFSLELYFGSSTWKYTCHQCRGEFELPVISGTAEMRQRICPACGSDDIERVSTPEFKPCLYCG